MDLRRHSIQSLKSTKSHQKENQIASKHLLSGKNWFEVYLGYQKSLLPIEESTFILDILRDLFDEEVDNVIKLHLLSLLEQYWWLVCDSERLEQTVGSLINIFQSSQSDVDVRCKYLYSCTVLWICQFDLVNESLEGLLKSFTKILVNLLNNKENKKLSNAACQCLIQLEETKPGITFDYAPDATIPRNHPTLLCLLLQNGSQFDQTIIKQLIGSLPRYTSDPFRLHTILNYLFELIETRKQVTLTPLVFKQFIPFFTHSSEAFHLHFALLLLRSFGLELFSTHEELDLLHRLINLCTHPSLVIAHRLLFLDFSESLLPILKSSNLSDPSLFALASLDGPDTQEKKLSILCQTDMPDAELITNLKSIEVGSGKQSNQRATNTLYRQLYFFLTIRPTLQQPIENLLINLITAAPSLHIPYTLCLLDRLPMLSPRISTSLVTSLLTTSHPSNERSYLREYFLAIKWILRQPKKLLDPEKLIAILTFCYNSAKQHPFLCKDLLAIIAVIIRHQSIDENLKSLLNEILDLLMTNKNRVTISSWSQIYSIALNTLPSQENLRKVFCSEETENDNLPLIAFDASSNSIPLSIQEIKCTPDPVAVSMEARFAIPYTLRVSFNSAFTDDEEITQKLFAIEIRLTCVSQDIHTIINLPVLRKDDFKIFQFKLSPIRVKPFTLTCDLRFGDTNGVTYCCPQFTSESFSFERFMVPLKSTESQFDNLWNSLIKQIDCHLTVQCFRNYTDLDQFLIHNQTFKGYLISPDKLAIGVAPNKLLLIRSFVVNGNLNFRMLTNLDKILKYLYYLFKQTN